MVSLKYSSDDSLISYAIKWNNLNISLNIDNLRDSMINLSQIHFLKNIIVRLYKELYATRCGNKEYQIADVLESDWTSILSAFNLNVFFFFSQQKACLQWYGIRVDIISCMYAWPRAWNGRDTSRHKRDINAMTITFASWLI